MLLSSPHADVSAFYMDDPLLPCTCHRLFLQWDRVVDWTFCGSLVAFVLLIVWTLASMRNP